MLSGIANATWGAGARLDGRRLLAGPRFISAVAWLSATAAFIAQVEATGAWLTLPVVAGFGLGAIARARRLAIFLALVPLAFWGYARLRIDYAGSDDISKLPRARACVFQARVVSVAGGPSASITRALVAPYEALFPANRRVSGLMMLTIRGSRAVAAGDHIEVKAHLIAPSEKRYPWEFDSRAYFRRCGVHSLAAAPAADVKVLMAPRHRSQESTAGVHDLLRWFGQCLDDTRSRVISVHHRYIGGVEGDLLSAMVLGDRAVSLDPGLKDRFRDAGLSHLLAASGFNLTIVVAMTWWIGQCIVRIPLAANALCFLSMLMFVCLAGPSPSVMRAALMCSLVLAGRCLFRSPGVTSSLAVALLITLSLDPSSIIDVGLQLSYLATFGIVCGAQALSAWMTPAKPVAAVKWFVEAVAVVLVAQLSILPLQLTYFFQVGLLFLPANLLVVLAVPMATALGFVSSASVLNESTAGLASPMTAFLDWLASYPVRWILFVVDCISRVESSKLTVGPPPLLASVGYFAAFLIFLLCLRHRSYRRSSLCLLLAAAAALLWRAPLPPLTVATFPGALVIIDANRHSVCLGDCSGKSAARFLSYNGVKISSANQENFKVRVSGAWTTVESVSPPASVLVGWPAADWQPPETIPAKLAALVILGKGEPSAGKKATASMYWHAWKIARENHADWLVLDSACRGRSAKADWPDEQPAGPGRTSVAFLGGHAVVLTSTDHTPLRLRPYSP